MRTGLDASTEGFGGGPEARCRPGGVNIRNAYPPGKAVTVYMITLFKIHTKDLKTLISIYNFQAFSNCKDISRNTREDFIFNFKIGLNRTR